MLVRTKGSDLGRNKLWTIKFCRNFIEFVFKVLTVRGTAFAKAEEGGSAPTSDAPAADASSLATFVKQELTKSDRPELTAANRVSFRIFLAIFIGCKLKNSGRFWWSWFEKW